MLAKHLGDSSNSYIQAAQDFIIIEKTRGANLLQESMSKGDMNPVMYCILKMVGYKVQLITFSQIFHNFYTFIRPIV